MAVERINYGYRRPYTFIVEILGSDGVFRVTRDNLTCAQAAHVCGLISSDGKTWRAIRSDGKTLNKPGN